MIIIKILILITIGISAGVEIGTGLSAVFASLGLITRYAYRTSTTSRIRLYENQILFGASFANLGFLYLKKVNISQMFAVSILFFLGIFFGIFVGCLAMAIAEILDAFTIMLRQIKIEKGEGFVVSSVAIGKLVGNLMYFFVWNVWKR